MDTLWTIVLVLSLCCASIYGDPYQTIKWPGNQNEASVSLRMPGAKPKEANSYLHSAFKLPSDKRLYITSFTALTTSDVTHHMLIYGCSEPGGEGIWNGGACQYSPQIIFAWAKNAPSFNMPKDIVSVAWAAVVTFLLLYHDPFKKDAQFSLRSHLIYALHGVGAPVGMGTDIQYIVIQIHYKLTIPEGSPADTSGIKLKFTHTKPQYISGIFLLVGMDSIPAGKKVVHVDVSCKFPGKTPIYPFAARVHAHDLAVVIAGYIFNGTWTMIAKGNPQWPQAFYPVKTRTVIHPGEETFARCTYNSEGRSTDTDMGPKADDEMCNLYIMYYTDSKSGSSFEECVRNRLSSRMKQLPKSSDVPLPPNPALDAMAHSHSAMGGKHSHHSDDHPNVNTGEVPSAYDKLYDYFVKKWKTTHDAKYRDLAKFFSELKKSGRVSGVMDPGDLEQLGQNSTEGRKLEKVISTWINRGKNLQLLMKIVRKEGKQVEHGLPHDDSNNTPLKGVVPDKGQDYRTITWPSGKDQFTDSLTMPGARPTSDNAYLHSAFKLPDMALYITSFSALATADVAHHMLIFGCREPGGRGIWDGQTCKSSFSIIFAWAKNAPSFNMPKDVGAQVGKGTDIKYIVIQIHYKYSLPVGSAADRSGIKITLTQTVPRYKSGIYLLNGGAEIPAGQPRVHVNVSCNFPGPATIYPFAARAHAHELAVVISGYMFNGTWTMIAKGNPQWPQAFYPLETRTVIHPGDETFAQCTYNSTSRSSTTYMGPTADDEMCNLYIMYYTDSKSGSSFEECGRNRLSSRMKQLPKSSDVPLPPNPALDAMAHSHSAMGGKHSHHSDDHPNVNAEISLVEKKWPKSQEKLGQVGGLATDKDGNVYVFHRGDNVWSYNSFSSSYVYQKQNSPVKDSHPVLVYSREGKLINSWGKGDYFLPHGITVDTEGNVWLTDTALHQVFRIPAGQKKPNLTLGKRFVPGKGNNQFCQPADVAVLSNGDFFVADGYCNSRIVKFTKEGKFVKEWSKHNPPSTLNNLNTQRSRHFGIVHSITVAEDKGLVCVADRENGLIQCFNFDGEFKKEIKSQEKIGTRIFAIEYCPSHGGVLFAVNGDNNNVPVQGVIIDLNSGMVFIDFKPSQQGFHTPHDIAVDNADMSVYVGEIGPNKVWKFKVEMTQGPIQPPQKVSTTTTSTMSPAYVTDAVNGSSWTVHSNKKESNQVAIIIACLLVIPIAAMIIMSVCIKIYKNRGFCCQRRSTNLRVFNLGTLNYFKSHKGFNKISTEDSDHEIDPLNESDEEYSAPRINART